jgi:Zn-dependent protease with chaperone function
MSLLSLGASVALAWFVVAALLATAAAAAAGSLGRRLGVRPAPGVLLACCLAPASVGAAAAVVSAAAFWIFEPRPPERGGPVLFALAALAVALVAAGAGRALGAVQGLRGVVRRWMRDAEPLPCLGVGMPVSTVRDRFPVVALVGILRPRIVVASQVVQALTPDELRAAIDHEMSHYAAGDNLKRALLAACPPQLGWTGLARAWAQAAERAADAAVAARGARAAAELASALVKVARLAVGQPSLVVPANALYDGGPVVDRVRRLIDMRISPPLPASRRRVTLIAVTILVGLAPAVPPLLPRVHTFSEALVRLLQ